MTDAPPATWSALAAVLASHNRIHALIAAGRPLREILTEVVHGIERYDGALRGSVLLLDRDAGTLHDGAAPSLPPAYVAAIDGLQVGPAVGSCGSAAHHGEEVVTPDIDRDPRWSAFVGLARAHGLRSCWSFPIRGASGDVLGTFGVYGAEPREPSDAHRDFLRDAAHLAGIAIDRDRADLELVRRATHDSLTGLPNRALLFDRLSQALARSRRRRTPLALLAIDLDRLSLVNDTLGHEVGDVVLRRTAEQLHACVRPGDTVARFGGDEFLVIAEDVGAVEAASIADRAMEALSAPIVDGPATGLTMTASVGIAVVEGADADALEAVRRAEDALRFAQDEGGNRHRHTDRTAAAPAARRLLVEAALRGALARGELRLVGQPVHRFADGGLQATEALLRWRHPELGDVSPAEFVPIAEQVGLIEAIGAWVLREACAETAELHRATGDDGIQVGVNVSPRQLRDPGFPDLVRRTLEATGIDPSLLVVEITETALLGSDPTTTRALAQLKAMGAHLVLDDFGTGFSSLSMLKDHPIDGIKIDRSFVQGLPGDASSAAIVSAVIGMARGLGRRVTAEGIETEEQRAYLANVGCDFAQGYLLARPAPYTELRAAAPTA